MALHAGAVLLGPLQRLNQRLWLKVQLHQIINGAQMHGLLCKLEILKVGKENKSKFAVPFLAGFNQLQTVHHRHTDIRDDNIRPGVHN